MYATVSLMSRGATVFRNTSCVGKTDICFKYEDALYEIDVKLARLVESRGYYTWRTTTAYTVKKPVYPLLVVPATGLDLSGWYCKWVGKRSGVNPEPNCPPGLETFWD